MLQCSNVLQWTAVSQFLLVRNNSYFLKGMWTEPLQSIRVCFNVLEPKIWPGSWTVLRTAFTAGFFLGGRALHWLNHAFCWSSKLFIYLHSLLACDMAGRSFSRNSCLKYSVLLVGRLGHPRPVLSPSASRVGFQGVPYRRNYVPKSVFLAFSYLSFFLFPLFNVNPSVKPLSPVISGKGSVLAWPALPTCLWRVS